MQVIHTDEQGDYCCDADGYPDTISTDAAPFDEFERSNDKARPCPEEADPYMVALIACAVLLAGVGYCLHWMATRPAAVVRWAAGTSAPFAALAVLIVGGIAAASALALVFAH